MSIDEKMAAFEAVAKHMIDETKKQGDFHIIALKNRGYSIQINLAGKKRGWSMDFSTTLSDFKKEFERNIVKMI